MFKILSADVFFISVLIPHFLSERYYIGNNGA